MIKEIYEMSSCTPIRMLKSVLKACNFRRKYTCMLSQYISVVYERALYTVALQFVFGFLAQNHRQSAVSSQEVRSLFGKACLWPYVFRTTHTCILLSFVSTRSFVCSALRFRLLSCGKRVLLTSRF